MLPATLKRLIPGCILGILCSLGTVVSSSTCPTPLLLQLSNCTIAGTNVDSWGLMLDLANPSQYVCVSPSTVTNSTLVISSAFCQTDSNITTAQCESLCGNTFNTSAAGTSYTSSSAGAILAPNPLWNELSPAALLAGTTVLQLPPNDELFKYPIGIITSGDHQNVGHFGLANDSDFLLAALSNGLIPANGFGLNAGSQSVANPRPGGLVLGGYDLASVDGAFTNFSITGADSSERDCPLEVVIEELVLRFPLAEGYTDVTLTSSGILIPACVEPYDDLFRVPQTLLQSFQEATGWSADTAADVDSDLYIVEPGLYYPQMKGFNGSLIFTLNNGFVVEISNEELANPLRGIDPNGARRLQPNITEVNIFSQGDPLNTAVLGKVFLSQVYLAVDYTMSQFKLAQIVPGSVPAVPVPFNSTSNTCSSQSPSTGKSGLSAGDIAGIAIGSFAGVIIIVAAFYFFYWRHRPEEKSDSQPSPVASGGTKTPLTSITLVPQELELVGRGERLDHMPVRGHTPNGSLSDE